MRIVSLAGLIAGTMFLMTGCQLEFISGVTFEDDTVVVEEQEPYVDAYVYIPLDIKEIIEERVYGYSMPPVTRYGYTLYPTAAITDNNNIPSYVKADFNGDGYSDYAYMFSKIWYDGSGWMMKTKMLILTSTSYGHTVSAEIDLGTVTGSNATPIEEYWGIRLLGSGTHTVTVSKNGYEKETIVELSNDGLYLASIDPAERSVFYVDGTESHEIVCDLGSIAKKKAAESRADRIIKVGI